MQYAKGYLLCRIAWRVAALVCPRKAKMQRMTLVDRKRDPILGAEHCAAFSIVRFVRESVGCVDTIFS